MTLWYVGRAAGTVSLVAFTLAVVLGALGSTVSSRAGLGQPRRRFLQQYTHRAAAVVGLGAVAAHIGSLTVLDSQSGVRLRSVVIPMSSAYRPLAVTVGALALWIVVFSAVAGASRGRLAGSVSAARRWRLLHVAAYAGWMLSVGHGLLAGTDARTPWMVGLQAGCMAAVLVAVAARLSSQARYRAAPLVRSRGLLAASPARAVSRSQR